MTPDGIPTPEWDRVHELAVEVANASMQDDAVLSEAKTEEMLCYLRELRIRHGDLPSILGTLGDYTDDEAPGMICTHERLQRPDGSGTTRT